jgi:hypothetical protein
MSANRPRVQTALEPELFADVKRLARTRGVSLSRAARDLIREAVEFHEDTALDGVIGNRCSSWNPRTALTSSEVRARLEAR